MRNFLVINDKKALPLHLGTGVPVSNLYCLLAQIAFHQHLQQLIAVDLTDQGTGVVMICDVSGILGQNVTHDLIDRVIAFFLQSMIDRRHDLLDFFIFFLIDVELTCQIYHIDTTFLPANLLVLYHNIAIIHAFTPAVKDFCESLSGFKNWMR